MKTILIADGERSIRKALHLCFISQGYFVFFAKNFIEAQSILKSIEFDLVIYDTELPGGTALDFYNRANEYCEAKFIFTSAFPELTDVLPVQQVEETAFLEKPFTISMIQNTISDIFSENLPIAV